MLSFTALIALLPLLAAATPISMSNSKRDGSLKHIHPNGDTSKCLVVPKNSAKPFTISPGYLVEVAGCDDIAYYSEWRISSGNNGNGIELESLGLCMDAGSNPGNNGQLKVWTCYPGLYQQTWYYTDDEHIAITGGNQCIDIGPNPATGVQTYQCFGGNTNQIFSVSDIGSGSTPTTTSTSVSSGPTSTPSTDAVMLHFSGTSVGCLTVGHGYLASGSVAYINSCSQTSGDTYSAGQLFHVTRGQAGPVNVAADPNLCLDAGVNPGQNGSPITIYNCLKQADGSPIPQQNWYYTDDNHLAITGGTQCLDVVADSVPGTTKPDGSIQDVQTWQCSGSDFQQIFTTMKI